MHASPRVQASPPSPEWGTVPPPPPCQGRLCWLGGLGARLSGTGRRILGSQRGVSSLVFSPECRVLCPQASVVFRDNPAGRNFLKTRLSEEPFPLPRPTCPAQAPASPWERTAVRSARLVQQVSAFPAPAYLFPPLEGCSHLVS